MRRAQDRARSATIESRALGALKLAREARNENVPARRADFFYLKPSRILSRLKLASARAQSAPRDRATVFLTRHCFFFYEYNCVKFYKKLP